MPRGFQSRIQLPPRGLGGRHLRVYISESQCMRHYSRQPSQVAGDNPAGRTRNRVRHSQDKNSNAFDMNTQPQAERHGTSSGINPPESVAIPASVQAQAPCAGAFAEPLDRRPRQYIAVPTTTMAQASNSVTFPHVGANEQNSPRGESREKERNIAVNTNHNNSSAGSIKIGNQNHVQVPEVKKTETNHMNQNTSALRITPNGPTSGSRESEEHLELRREQQRKQDRL